MEEGATNKSEGFPSPTTYFWLGSRQTYTLRSDAVVREEDLRHIYNNFHFVGRFIAHLSHHYYYNTLSVICQVLFCIFLKEYFLIFAFHLGKVLSSFYLFHYPLTLGVRSSEPIGMEHCALLAF